MREFDPMEKVRANGFWLHGGPIYLQSFLAFVVIIMARPSIVEICFGLIAIIVVIVLYIKSNGNSDGNSYEETGANAEDWLKSSGEICSPKKERRSSPTPIIIGAIIAVLVIAVAVYFQTSTFTDSRDKKTYKKTTIGKQTWMAENLNFEAKDSKCYKNTPANCEKYGRLYNWETAMKACPSGWHLPRDNEWLTLVNFAGGREVAGKKLKTKSGWKEKGNGTDEFGFSALPGGIGYSDGDFNHVGNHGLWWSSSESDSDSAYIRIMYYNFDGVDRDDFNKSYLFSVRCLQD